MPIYITVLDLAEIKEMPVVILFPRQWFLNGLCGKTVQLFFVVPGFLIEDHSTEIFSTRRSFPLVRHPDGADFLQC